MSLMRSLIYLLCFAGVVWLFLGSQTEGLISRLDCSDGLAKPLGVKVIFVSEFTECFVQYCPWAPAEILAKRQNPIPLPFLSIPAFVRFFQVELISLHTFFITYLERSFTHGACKYSR